MFAVQLRVFTNESDHKTYSQLTLLKIGFLCNSCNEMTLLTILALYTYIIHFAISFELVNVLNFI